MLSAWNRKVCVNGSFMLFNFLWFCLYCMYFFKGFWGRPQKYRSACERGRTCIFTGYPPPLQLQSGLLCTCITEAPNKTHCGWLVRKRKKNARLCLGLCSTAASVLLTFTPAHRPAAHFFNVPADYKTKQSENSKKILSKVGRGSLRRAPLLTAFITTIKEVWCFLLSGSQTFRPKKARLCSGDGPDLGGVLLVEFDLNLESALEDKEVKLQGRNSMTLVTILQHHCGVFKCI